MIRAHQPQLCEFWRSLALAMFPTVGGIGHTVTLERKNADGLMNRYRSCDGYAVCDEQADPAGYRFAWRHSGEHVA